MVDSTPALSSFGSQDTIAWIPPVSVVKSEEVYRVVVLSVIGVKLKDIRSIFPSVLLAAGLSAVETFFISFWLRPVILVLLLTAVVALPSLVIRPPPYPPVMLAPKSKIWFLLIK